jgi:F0F1-type ATP synthase membrane subunit c/vacuolar-type H+-ATPase subunit K
VVVAGCVIGEGVWAKAGVKVATRKASVRANVRALVAKILVNPSCLAVFSLFTPFIFEYHPMRFRVGSIN